MRGTGRQADKLPCVVTPSRTKRLVVLVSGAGNNLQALIDACQDPAYGASVVAVGADREGIEGLARAERAGIPTFVRAVQQFSSRGKWDRSLAETVSRFDPDVVVLAGFMKLVGEDFLEAHGGRVVNTHPALCPAFPGTSGPADALAYGVKVTGATLFVVDGGVDTGPIIAQAVVPVEDDDDVASLHERIKVAERTMLVDNVGRMAREGIIITNRKVRFGS
ncbi:MAG TPA: phosphoribosylglycinamide formyltransferase [Nocardioides sp.]